MKVKDIDYKVEAVTTTADYVEMQLTQWYGGHDTITIRLVNMVDYVISQMKDFLAVEELGMSKGKRLQIEEYYQECGEEDTFVVSQVLITNYENGKVLLMIDDGFDGETVTVWLNSRDENYVDQLLP